GRERDRPRRTRHGAHRARRLGDSRLLGGPSVSRRTTGPSNLPAPSSYLFSCGGSGIYSCGGSGIAGRSAVAVADAVASTGIAARRRRRPIHQTRSGIPITTRNGSSAPRMLSSTDTEAVKVCHPDFRPLRNPVLSFGFGTALVTASGPKKVAVIVESEDRSARLRCWAWSDSRSDSRRVSSLSIETISLTLLA